jgi:hypothetical protein
MKKFLVCFSTSLYLCVSADVFAAEWRECEQAKLRQLDLQQSRRQASASHKRKKSTSRSSQSRASVESLDDWLWKNCREYSYELRTLEQQRM